MKKIVRGNDFTLRIPVCKIVDGEQVAFPLPACTDIVVNIVNQYRRVALSYTIDTAEDNIINARVEGDAVSVGTYALEVRGKIFGNDWRSKEYEQFAIVDNNASGDTAFNGELIEGEDSVEMDTAMVILPPSVELSDLISDTNEALGKIDGAVSKTDEAVKKANDAVSQANGALEKVQNVDIDVDGTNLNITRPSGEKKEFDLMQLKGEKGDKGNAFTFSDFTPEELASLKGEKGEKGEKGDMGSIGKISISVDNTTGTPSATASSSKAADGSTDISFSFKGIKGEKGEKGERGEQGLQGERGEQGLPGNDGAKGDKGDAFTYNDFTPEQLAALKGPKGDKGDIGLTGPQGETGPVGPQGPKGDTGAQGEQGIQGVKGDPFSYADFTAEQIKELQKPATDIIVTLGQTKVDCENATKAANDAASDATVAKTKAENAASGAEKCNVILEGSTVKVTNRNGETKSVDVINTDEEVTVTISSSVESIKVTGIKINVFLNNGKTPQTYTTNAEGKATFTIDRGNYYQVVFPEYGNAQPIAPVGFTAVLATRNIDVEYKPYDEESMENVVVTVTKYTDGTGAAYEGVPVVVTVDRENTTYNTDARGQVSLYVPYGKEFTVNVENQDGYSVSLNRNTRTYTASVPQRLIDYKMYQFRAGIFIIDGNLNEYYLEEWQAAGKTAEEAVAIKVADANLTLNRGTFMIRISDMLAPTALPKKSWCTQGLQFDSIALNGNNTKDANYYNGESSSFLVRQEAVERSLSVPAFDYAYEQIFSIAGHELHGFLMSVGQDYVHIANIGIIKQVLTALCGEEVATAYYNFVMKQARWTSTQYNVSNAWLFSSSASSITKSDSFFVLPVFAC